ncbi:DNA2/NAM7 helicase AAA [Gracilaria domingensis]|nr:DNA2/NAM7 helicase AAA [Gracilaria domingensis]
MSYLLTYLSEPFDDDRQTWEQFRRQVAIQIKNCRQCATKYHQAVAAWEVGDELASWPKSVAKRRVQALLDWDCDRVIPSILIGADINENDPAQRGAMMQCREAFLEALISLRLCTCAKFCAALGTVFRKRTPARNAEDVIPFIRSLKFIPSGLLALCFHDVPAVQVWALRIYNDSRGLQAGLPALLYLFRKELKRINELQEALECDTYLDSSDYESDIWKLQSRWESFSTLFCKADQGTMYSFVEDGHHLKLMRAVSLATASKFEKVVKAGCRIFRLLLRRVSYDVLFVSSSFTPKELLDHVLLGVRRPSNSSNTRENLLGLLSPVFTLVRSNCDKEKVARLYTRCLQKLYDIAGIAKICGLTTQAEALETLPGIENNSRDRHTLLKVTSQLLLLFYRYSVPALPVEDPVMISNIVISAVWEDATSDWSWDLLRFVLLTDAFNIIRNIKPSKDVEVISSTFLDERVTIGEKRADEEHLLSELLHIGGKSKPKRTWVGPLWRKVLSGTHIRSHDSHSDAVMEREMSVLLDLHRVIGILDNRMVQATFDDEEGVSQSYGQSSPSIISKQKRRLVESINTVQELTWSRFRRICDMRSTQTWMRLLPFHAAHLLSSAKKDVSVQCLAAMRRSFGLQNNSSLSSQSKLLATAVKKNPEAASMLVDGVYSSLRIMYALGDMVSPRTYASFFLWFQILHDSGYTSLLRARSTSRWAMAVVQCFSVNWKSFEKNIGEEEYGQTCCQFFTKLREIWSILYADANRKASPQSQALVVRNATKGLFSMHCMKDSGVLASWAYTMASMASEWKTSEEHRSAMCKIIASHANGSSEGNRMTFEQCEMLVQKGGLDAAKSFLKGWSKIDKKATGNDVKPKVLNSTRIDHFFPRKAPEPSRDRHPQIHGIRNNTITRGPIRNPRPRLPLARTILKPVRANGPLSDLRKELLGDAPVRPKARRGLQPESQPTKTPFEIQIEQARAKKAARLVAESNRVLQSMDVNDKLSSRSPSKEPPVDLEGTAAREVTPSPDPEQELLRECTLPKSVRNLPPRDMDLVYRALIHKTEPKVSVSGDFRECGKTYANVEEYVEFWEPLLISECRASIQNTVREENNFASQFQHDANGYRYCRTAFEVQEPPSSIGYFHQLRLNFCPDQGGIPKEFGQDLSSSQFSVFQAQPTDLVYLRIPPARCTERDGAPQAEAIALVSTSKVEKGVRELVLQICFDDGLDKAPGKGRRIQISRLSSLVTFQRQIEALWSISNLPDGILWPILDPSQGLSVNDRVYVSNRETSTGLAAAPSEFICDLEKSGGLNHSQADAIGNVVRSSGPLLQYHGPKTNERFFKKNHGALSLIQGPPGTGKTSTIMNMISAFITTSQNRSFPRAVRVSVDDVPLRIRIPAIRVLVCAPSNAAVDEIMSRVVGQGLTFPGGTKACPRIVRVGAGTTIDQLKRFELRLLAKSRGQRNQAESDLKDTKTRLDNQCRALQQVNERISKAHTQRCVLIEKEAQSIKLQKSSSPELLRQIQSLTERLTILHEEKDVLKGHLCQVRDERKVQDRAIRMEKMKRMSRILNQSNLVFSTLNSAGHEMMKTLGVSFDVIIIDEAAQSIEPESLIPMTLGAKGRSTSKFSHVVLVGDAQQLPATVVSTNPSVVKHLRTSLFERMCLSDRHRATMLNVQYRMHPTISSFPNKQFYFGEIRDGPKVAEKHMTKCFHRDSKRRFGPLTFYDTSKLNHVEKRTAKGSVSNLSEARLVIKILRSLIRSYRSEDFNDSIVLLSPYRQQVFLLQQLVRECRILSTMNVEVSTIDGIQGREKQIVVLSTVRGGNAKDIGFVNDERRMNVALTRAQHSLLVVGSALVLSRTSMPWQGLVSHCRENSHLISISTNCDSFFAVKDNVGGRDTNAGKYSAAKVVLQGLSCAVPNRGARVKDEDVPNGGDPSRSRGNLTMENTCTRSSAIVLKETKKPLLRSCKRPATPERTDKITSDVKRIKGNPEDAVGLTAVEGNLKISASIRSEANACGAHAKRTTQSGDVGGKQNVDDEQEKTGKDVYELRKRNSLQESHVSVPVDGGTGGRPEVAKKQTKDSAGNSMKTLPLRSNVLISIPSTTEDRARKPKAGGSTVVPSNPVRAQKVEKGPERPFVPWKRKTNSTPKDGSPFEKDPAARFVPPGMSKSPNSKRQDWNASKLAENTTEHLKKMKKMVLQSPQGTPSDLRSRAVRSPHLNQTPPRFTTPHGPKTDVLSRLGNKGQLTRSGNSRQNAPWEQAQALHHATRDQSSSKWSQSLASSGYSPRSRPQTNMRQDGTSKGMPSSKGFLRVRPEIRKMNQKNQRNYTVHGPGHGSSNPSRNRRKDNLGSMPMTNVNHRGFVKKIDRDEQRMRGNTFRKRRKEMSNAKPQSAPDRNGRTSTGNHQGNRAPPRHGPFVQTRSMYSSRNGANPNLNLANNDTNTTFGHRPAASHNHQSLTFAATQSNFVQQSSRTRVTPKNQKGMASGSLLQRLQADQARTLNIVNRAIERR